MKKIKITAILLLALFAISSSFAQGFPEKEMKKKLKASKIEMDGGNGDGVFKAQSKKTKKWGIYQWMYEGTDVKEMIPMEYDKVDDFPFNGAFTTVYNDGKLGIYLCEWSYGDDAKQTVPCEYEKIKKYTVGADDYSAGQLYTAFMKDGKWGWVNWKTGEEKSEFIYDELDDLPYPKYEQ